MQKWEYLQIAFGSFDIYLIVLSEKDDYFTREQYKALDPKIEEIVEYSKKYWNSRYCNKFLIKLLNKLGSDGWEVTGTQEKNIFLKRPIE